MAAEHNHHRPGAHSAPVLDIGGEVGALVVYLAHRPFTGELEACPAGAPAARFHTGVHHRSIIAGPSGRGSGCAGPSGRGSGCAGPSGRGSGCAGPSGRGSGCADPRAPESGRDGCAWTAVFPEVTEGRYELLDEGGVPMADVVVTGGAVHQLDLR
jgi:hypothetical protein